MPESMLNVFYFRSVFQKHCSMCVSQGVKVETFIFHIIVNHTAAMLHNTRLNIRSIFTDIDKSDLLACIISLCNDLVFFVFVSVRRSIIGLDPVVPLLSKVFQSWNHPIWYLGMNLQSVQKLSMSCTYLRNARHGFQNPHHSRWRQRLVPIKELDHHWYLQ